MTDGYLIRSAEIWDQARAAYLAGQTAPAVCERFGIGLSNFRLRAREEGWRKSDMPDPDLDDPEDDEVEEIGEADIGEAMRTAAWRMTSAVRRGMVHEALSWGRLHAMAARQVALAEHERQKLAERERRIERGAALSTLRDVTSSMRGVATEARSALAAAKAAGDLHDLHDLHPVSPPAADPAPADAPLTRAERRRRLREGKKRR